jgi:hypothetical protein
MYPYNQLVIAIQFIMGLENTQYYGRIKTIRTKKRLQKNDLEKQVLELNRERDQLYEQISNLGYRPLIPPLQRGWKRMFVMREDVKRSVHAEFFLDMLKIINTKQYSHKKDFKVKRRRFGKKVYVDKIQTLKKFHHCELVKLKLTPKQLNFFSEVVVYDYKGQPYPMYEFNESWRYVLKVMPNIITEVKVKDHLLEKRITEISNYLERNNLCHKLVKILDGSYNSKRWNYRYRNPKNEDPLRNVPLYRIKEVFD